MAIEHSGAAMLRPAGGHDLRVTAVTCVKNEGPFLLEWIAFNRVIGVTDHLIYSNDCDDGTDALLDALAREGICTHLPNPAQGRNYQMEALKHAARHPLVTDADWVWIADVDEFLNIHAGNGTVQDLIAACGDPAAISVHFQFFANGGVEDFEDRPVISQFTRTHNPDLFGAERAIEVKSLVRRDFPLRYFGAHRPFARGALPVDLRWTDGSGRPVPMAFRRADRKGDLRSFPAWGSRRHATLNHYALRSLQSYLVKIDRGDVNRAQRDFDTAYWQERNDDGFEERSILKYLPRLEAELSQLGSLADVAALHAASVAAHRAKVRHLETLPEFRARAAALRATPSRPAAEIALLEELGPPVLAMP